ncbi:hypothetical protein BMF94_0481 [Rhodotorula taiwanensis]|uniref:Uncharacterized protein n=1 Tax=Rhodotorula taiwanensis TaxID=741276 RepID=A0A2S5BHN7_9BASI|nr:hypothetical protein BMF94_0481 [Rhodotorula taiwanensis]
MPDPDLTSRGVTQCLAIPTMYPNFFASLDPSDTVLLVSPLRRTLQTLLLGFSSVLPPAAQGDRAVPVIVLPQLQECGSWPCDTGAPIETTKRLFPQEYLDWTEVDRHPEWNENTGAFRCDDERNNVERARWVRNYIRQRKEKHVVVVSHHGLLRRLVKAPHAHNRMKSPIQWENAALRVYRFTDELASDPEADLARLEDFAL